MSSILTNTSSMVALQTLRSINQNLAKTQAEISTGKSVASAKDNASVWAISKVMEADVSGFKTIADSLSLGQSTVAVARQAAETVTNLLKDIKTKIVAAQENNVDRSKLQDDLSQLRDQITSVVSAAQFNGLNLIDGSVTSTNSNSATGIDVLSSLDRASDGTVSSSSIGVNAQNLTTTAGTSLTGASVGTDTGTAGVIDAADSTGTTDEIKLDTFAFLDSSGGATGTAALSGDAAGVDTSVTTGLVVGDQLSLTIGSVTAKYTVKEGDTAEALVAGMKNALLGAGLNTSDFTLDIDTAAGELRIVNNTNEDVSYSFSATRGSGGLADLAAMDISTAAGASTALGQIEGMIQTAVDAATAFGAVENRLSIQADFVSKLTDAMNSGISAISDADMEEASARLQALQVQQQLGIQALSIANQAPQNILSLFR